MKRIKNRTNDKYDNTKGPQASMLPVAPNPPQMPVVKPPKRKPNQIELKG